jgi:hypothetical protein
MIELKLRKIMKQVKSDNPAKRYEALDKLHEYKQIEGLEVQIDMLKDMIALAAGKFPEPVDTWDNPSYYLVDFLCDFPMEEVVKEVLNHFDGFHLHAKERALEFLLSTEYEGIFYELEDKINHLVRTELLILPTDLLSYPLLVKGILDKNKDLFHSAHYKFMFYDLLLALHSSGYEQSYERNYVLPIMLDDYKTIKDSYLQYNSEYNTEYVYKSWRDNYFKIRGRMRMFLNLMEYYFTDETESELIKALDFHDPLIKTEATLVCIQKNIQIDKAILIDCANDIESAEMLYWELQEKNKEHLYPIKESKQQHLAKSRLFSYITNLPVGENEIHKLPLDIQTVESIETENAYGQPIRYYLMSFKELDSVYIAWVGGYALEDGDDSAQMWDGTYTDFIELDSATIEEHKKKFFSDREEGKQQYERYVHYESSPKLSKGLWFFYAILIMQWLRVFSENMTIESFIFPAILSVIAGIITLIEKHKNKTSKVAIIGRELVMLKGKTEISVPLAEVKKVEYNKKHISVSTKQNEVIMRFPMRWVYYGQFYYNMIEQTKHLKERPFIEE